MILPDKEHALAAAQIIEQWGATALRCDGQSRPVGNWKCKATGGYLGIKPEMASEWLVRDTTHRLGMIPGTFNRLCIDVDTREINPVDFLQSNGFPEPVLVTESIGGKGTHIWYSLPDGVSVIGNGNWGDNRKGEHYGELRCHKGYVVERNWAQILNAPWQDFEPLENACHLVDNIKVSSTLFDGDSGAKGARNNTLNILLYTGFLKQGESFLGEAQMLCREAVDNGLPRAEVKATLTSARRSALGKRSEHQNITPAYGTGVGKTFAERATRVCLNINPFVDMAEVEEVEDRYLMDHLFQRGAVTVIFGEGSHGKSTVARDILARVQHRGNSSLIGRVQTTQLSGLKTMYYSGEETDAGQLKRRLRASGVDVADANFKLVNAAFNWTDRIDKAGAQSQLTALLKFIDIDKTDLFVIDSVSSLSMGDTSNPETVELIFRDILSPIINTGCSVVLIAHPRKDNWEGRMLDALKGSERWSTLARAVYICASGSKEIIDLNNAGNPLYQQKVVSKASERVGCIAPLKLNNIPESKQMAYHFEISSEGLVDWSTAPYSQIEAKALKGAHRPFGERVALRYRPSIKQLENAAETAPSGVQGDATVKAIADYVRANAGCKISEIIKEASPGLKPRAVSAALKSIGAYCNDYGWCLGASAPTLGSNSAGK